MQFAQFLSLLERRALFFSPPSQFSDPFEGQWSDATVARWPSIATMDQEKNDIGISCWCLSETESALHWNAFCPAGMGIAIESSVERIDQAIIKSGLANCSLFV